MVSAGLTLPPIPQPPQGRFEFVCADLNDGWKSLDVPWHTAGDGWLMAHDLFHHQPTDTGTPAQEVATYGAEDWFSAKGDPTKVITDALDKLSTTVFSIAMISTESLSDGLSIPELMLPPPPAPCSLDEFNPDLIAHWRKAYAAGMSEFQKYVEELATPEEWADLQSEDQVTRAVGWMAHGWHMCTARYPNPPLACEQFKMVAKVFTPLPQAGQRLAVIFDGDQVTFENNEPVQPEPSLRSRALRR